jgi:hypothetical protein
VNPLNDDDLKSIAKRLVDLARKEPGR